MKNQNQIYEEKVKNMIKLMPSEKLINRYRNLFRAVLLQQVLDINSNKTVNTKKYQIINNRRSSAAKMWLYTESCRIVCDYAGVDYSMFLKKINNMIEKNKKFKLRFER